MNLLNQLIIKNNFIVNSSKEFQKYATKHAGISSLSLHNYTSAYGNYINPTITEEITEFHNNRQQMIEAKEAAQSANEAFVVMSPPNKL